MKTYTCKVKGCSEKAVGAHIWAEGAAMVPHCVTHKAETAAMVTRHSSIDGYKVLKYDTGPLPGGTPEKDNWVDHQGGLPAFVRAVANALIRNGHPKQTAIQFALGSIKRWASGGGNVTPKTRAKAIKTVAEWEAMRAKAHARSIAKVEDIDVEDFQISVPIVKMDTDQKLAFGWASVYKDGAPDKQGDIIASVEDMENAAYSFVMDSRDGGEMHIRKGVATLVESMMFTPEKLEAMGLPNDAVPPGWWVGYKITDDGVWKAVKTGKYKMFSVGGRGKRKALDT